MQQHILVLGAGLVSQPLIDYFIKKNVYKITIASKEFDPSFEVEKSENIKVVTFDLDNDKLLAEMIESADIVVSLVPYAYHVKIARHCIQYKKDMVTASYISDEMKELDQTAQEAGIIILNEVGLDPGIDHMSAMNVIDEIHAKGGKILSFESDTGGLPFWDSITTPFKYKFSWSPVGVLMAAKNEAQFLEDGEVKTIPNNELFKSSKLLDLAEFGLYEVYPNRDSIKYIDLYGLKDIEYMYRGTIRNLGWSSVFAAIIDLDLLNNEKTYDLSQTSFNDFFCMHNGAEIQDAVQLASKLLDIDVMSTVIQKLKWAGLFSDEIINKKEATAFDVLLNRLNKNLVYTENENDLIIMYHKFIVQYGNDKKTHTSMFLASSENEKYSIMAKTVSLPAAIATSLILEQKIKVKGVQIPTKKSIYEPILEELEQNNIIFKEQVSDNN